jgi:methylamine utilization protein MauE|tara:strand:+ start:2041 stop:2529 length:489 start_codon:yes stop_codon:yes gene_type:complete
MSAIFIFSALLLAISAAHKLNDRKRMAVSVANIAGTSEFYGLLLFLLSGVIEAIAALALLLPGLHHLGGYMAAALWVVYSAALLRRYGQTLDCGCDLRFIEKPVGLFVIARPLILAALVLAVTTTVPLAWTGEAVFAAIAMLSLYFAASELAAISPRTLGTM